MMMLNYLRKYYVAKAPGIDQEQVLHEAYRLLQEATQRTEKPLQLAMRGYSHYCTSDLVAILRQAESNIINEV